MLMGYVARSLAHSLLSLSLAISNLQLAKVKSFTSPLPPTDRAKQTGVDFGSRARDKQWTSLILQLRTILRMQTICPYTHAAFFRVPLKETCEKAL
jgi:hypothetical protein